MPPEATLPGRAQMCLSPHCHAQDTQGTHMAKARSSLSTWHSLQASNEVLLLQAVAQHRIGVMGRTNPWKAHGPTCASRTCSAPSLRQLRRVDVPSKGMSMPRRPAICFLPTTERGLLHIPQMPRLHQMEYRVMRLDVLLPSTQLLRTAAQTCTSDAG